MVILSLLKHRITRGLLTTGFIIVVTVIGFAQYTSQVITREVATHIYHNPSQVASFDVAIITGSSEADKQKVADIVADLYYNGRVGNLLCLSEQLYTFLHGSGLPVQYLDHPNQNDNIPAWTDQLDGKSILLIASSDDPEAELYQLERLGLNAFGLTLNHANPTSRYSNAMSRLQIYMDIRLSEAAPYIANPRYTLDIQH